MMFHKSGHSWRLALLCIGLAVAAVSCKRPKDPQPLVDIAQKEYTLAQKGGRVEVSFVPLTAWSVSSRSEFVNFEPSAGPASKEELKLGIVVEENKSPYDRDIFVKISFEYNQVDIKITQKGLTDSPDKPDRPDEPDKPEKDTGETEDIVIGLPINNDNQ
ncbi:MAG: hypothetical protein ACI3ZF_05160 [Candidatus Cryptobacteroides sp.]